jgi:porin
MNDCADRGPSKWSADGIRWCGYALLVLAIACAAAPARAASDEVDSKGAPIPSIGTSLPGNGDPGGVRKWLYERGLTYSFVLTSELLGDVAGGMRRGAVFQGKLETIVRADLEKMFGLRGLSFFTNSFLIHNTGGIRRDYVGSFNTISNIEALSTMRLSELWLEQKLGDTFNVRFGQLAADAEFFIASYSDFLMTSDWPSIKAQTLPSGGYSSEVRIARKADSVFACVVQRRPGGAGPRGCADQEPLWVEFPRAGPAAADGRGAVQI